jgi:phage terminase small subunit
MRMNKLTAKQKRFVEEYLVDLNATQAAIRAGYPERSARSIGSENLAKPYIQEAVAESQAQRSRCVEVDQNYVIMKLKEETEKSREETSPHARVRALELLARHLGMFSEKEKPPEPNRDLDTITNPALRQILDEMYSRPLSP